MEYIDNIENLEKGDYILTYEINGNINTSRSQEKLVTVGQFSHLTKVKRMLNFKGYNYHRACRYRSNGDWSIRSYYTHYDCIGKYNHSRNKYNRTIYRLTEEEALLYVMVEKI